LTFFAAGDPGALISFVTRKRSSSVVLHTKMHITKHEILRRPLIFTVEGAQRLAEILSQIVPTVHYTAECEDGSRQFSNLGELLAYQNPRKRRIKTLTIFGVTEDHA
jgi:hypothetical protein